MNGTERMAMPFMRYVEENGEHCRWFSLVTSLPEDLSFTAWIKLCLSSGAAKELGWVETDDDAWIRLTPAGRAALDQNAGDWS